MANYKTKLELTWIGEETRPKLEPRLLLEDLPAPRLRQAGPEKSCHTPHRVTDHDVFDNRLICEDNLLVLNAL